MSTCIARLNTAEVRMNRTQQFDWKRLALLVHKSS